MSVHKIIIAGAPGAGKGTQCEKMVEKYGFVQVSTGDLIRAEVKKNNEWSKKANEIMNSGGLLPGDMVDPLLKARLEQEDCKKRGFILDGYPREPANRDYLIKENIIPTLVLLLEVPDEVAMERQCGRVSDPVTGKVYHLKFSPPDDPEVLKRVTKRATDNEEKAKVRLAVYHKEMGDLVSWYQKEIIVSIDGRPAPEEVFVSICKVIDNYKFQP